MCVVFGSELYHILRSFNALGIARDRAFKRWVKLLHVVFTHMFGIVFVDYMPYVCMYGLLIPICVNVRQYSLL